ncbi:tRNA lysidine(34) synthetase TilS [Fluviicola sp.]|jgi:tRNA(Ile)-lysidine synthase|uniref:tRNA lysidine(34) synthetase TilS n=1 Tax=Fluviicola sp. TaxID=1917219 RepID=UPI002837EA23|nr:tRNA lysidine(34) synthetase TilS [Fluviicola sp.]MDR0801152.1 tRNA lysidine(34) synthetase TilS [Fluviicola sp.]
MSVVETVVSTHELNRFNLCVACSGGLDSTVLLEILVSLGFKPSILHINYQLRGEESDQDETFVRDLARKYQLEIEVVRCPRALIKGNGINLQEAARVFRHELFRSFIQKHPGNRVLLAHHQDDQVETFFLQLIRGAGIFGLGGMHPERNGIIRPFLSLTKAELRNYAEEKQLCWREDSSNSENTYKRNQFRNILLPELQKRIPALSDSIRFLQLKFREEQQHLQENLQRRLSEWKQNSEISFRSWNELSPEEHILVCNSLTWPFWTIQRISELERAKLSSKIDNSPIFRTKEGFSWNINFLKTSHWEFKIQKVEFLPKLFSTWEAYIDQEKCISFPIQSTAKKTDTIQKIGTPGKSKVYKLMKDHGIPEQWRSTYPVFRSGKEIVWIPGIALSEKHVSGPDARVIIKLSKI